MKNYLSFLLLFSLLSILFGCKEEESNNPTWEPPCSGSFPELTDWSYQPITLPLSNGEYVGGLYFSETGKGVAASFNKIWITENDGQTWQNVYKSPITLLSNVNFTDPDHGFITGEFLYTAYLLITKDAGFNWDTIYFPAFQKFEYCSFADSLRGIAIIRDNHYQVYLAKTKDGG